VATQKRREKKRSEWRDLPHRGYATWGGGESLRPGFGPVRGPVEQHRLQLLTLLHRRRDQPVRVTRDSIERMSAPVPIITSTLSLNWPRVNTFVICYIARCV
jgi:hypothetical protein